MSQEQQPDTDKGTQKSGMSVSHWIEAAVLAFIAVSFVLWWLDKQ